MIVDAECGMPLDLAKWEALWEEGADESGELLLIHSQNNLSFNSMGHVPAVTDDHIQL